MNPLRVAVHEVMTDDTVHERYPEGLSAPDVLNEIRKRHPNAFPLVTHLDVYDELRALYGPAHRGGSPEFN